MPALTADKRPARPRGEPAAARRRRGSARTRRLLLRLAGGAAALALVAGVVSAVTGGAVQRGWLALRDGAYDLTAAAGFRVEEVLVAGRRSVDAPVVLYTLGIRRGDPILAFDPDAAREALEAIPRIAAASVERRLPDTIFVRIEEREPMALWQNGGVFRLVDQTGTELPSETAAAWPDLPLIVGPDAPRAAPALLELLADRPEISGRIEALVRVGGRRWDLHLDSGMVVRLPQGGLGDALDTLEMLQQEGQILDRAIFGLDLRIEDRVTIEAQPPAASAASGAGERT